MSIEKDINQSKFSNEHQKVMVNIIYSYNWMQEQVKGLYDKQDITPTQFNILRILRGASTPLSTLQIRQRMLDKMSDTSRIVDRLVTKGMVKKIISVIDKRLVEVSITTKGKKLLAKMDLSQNEMDSVCGKLSIKEAKTMNNLLDKMRG